MTISRRSLIQTSAAMSLGHVLPSWANTEKYPDPKKTIKAIVPSPPGSPTDAIARGYAQAINEAFNCSMIVENKPGAEGSIAMQFVKSQPADGYTIVFTSLSTQVINPGIFKKLPYDPLHDFIPIAGTMRSSLVLAAGPSIPFKTANELINAAKKSPGKYTFGSISSMMRIAGEMVCQRCGIDMLNIPYKNASDLLTNLASGLTDVMVSDIAFAQSYKEQGVKILATLSDKRNDFIPNVPTLAEAGFANVELPIWHGMFAPRKVSNDVIQFLQQGVIQASASKHVNDFMKRFGLDTYPIGSKELEKLQKDEHEKWHKLIADAGLLNNI